MGITTLNFWWGGIVKGLKVFGVSHGVIKPAQAGNGQGHNWTQGVAWYDFPPTSRL